jgi:putative N6-adenine-specific DNA methylase
MKKSRKRSIANQDCKQHAHPLTTIAPVKPFSILDHNFFASTLPGLEPILKQELISLGITTIDNDLCSKGGIHVRFKSLEELYKCHLYLGSCSHILLRVNEGFVANGMEELVRKVSKLEVWRQLIPCEKGRYPYFKITVSSKESKLYHTIGIAQRVERGICLALGLDEYIHVGTIEERSKTKSEPIPILVRIRNNKVQLSIDTSISPMHKRGYRLESSKAPLREDIAFALLYALGWKDNTINMNPILVDPLCGSGTILIEGAAMFFNLPAGRYRDTPMKHTLIGDSLLWKEMVQTATLEAQNNICKYLIKSKATPLAFGSDRDAGAIKAAVSNIQRADLSDVIRVKNCSLSSNPWISGETPTECNAIYLVTNPPYGVRVSHSKSSERVDKLLPLYQTIGNIVKHRGDVHLGMTVHDILLARKTGIPSAKTLFTTKHGGLTVSAVGFKNN